MSVPTVSVLVTTYNRERYVRASIESVLAQWYQDFEVVVVDDQSTDGTLAVVEELARRDPRIRVFRNERNLGDYANRNRAASHARGRFLKYHDSDDVMYPHCLQVMVSLLESVPEAGFGLSKGSAWAGGGVGILSTPRQSYRREFLGHGMFMCGPAGALFRREVFEALGGFEDVGAPSDMLLWLRACARYPVVLLPGDLFYYRVHEEQIVYTDAGRRELAMEVGYAWRALAAPECPLEGRALELARQTVLRRLVRWLVRDLRAGRLALAAHRVRQSGIGPRDWLRYFRRPMRAAAAGVEVDAAGDPLIPGWCRPPRDTDRA